MIKAKLREWEFWSLKQVVNVKVINIIGKDKWKVREEY
jgi:hypothetical protein